MIDIKVKPLSINKSWKGRRFKTDEYKWYEIECFLLLPKYIKIPPGYLEVFYEFWVSNNQSDWDNFCKNFQDILQKKYGFNDNIIMKSTVIKKVVPKGQERIRVKFISTTKEQPPLF